MTFPVAVEVPETIHEGDGVTTSFLIGFTAPVAANLVVTIDGVAQILGTDFNKVGDQVVFVTAPDDETVIFIGRRTPIAQKKAFPTQPTMVPKSVEDGLNEVVRISQELNARLNRAILIAPGETGPTEQQILDAVNAGVAANEALAAAILAGETGGSFPLSYSGTGARTAKERFDEMAVPIGEFRLLVVPGVGDLPDDWTYAANAMYLADRNVKLPGLPGGYYVRAEMLQRPLGNMLTGDGVDESYFVVDEDFDMDARGVMRIPVSAGERHAGFDKIGFVFHQPGANHISNIAVSAGGAGYSAQTYVTIYDPDGGFGALARPIIVGGVITSIKLTRRGEDYGPDTTVTITDPGGGAGATIGAITRVETLLREHIIQYPPVLSGRGLTRPFIGDIRITGGYAAFDLRDNTGGLMAGDWELGCIGWSIKGGGRGGASPALDFFNALRVRCWPHGFQDPARLAVWLDGETKGLLLGRIDGVSITSLAGYGAAHEIEGTAFDVSYVLDGETLEYDYAPPVPGGAASVELYTEDADFERTLLVQGAEPDPEEELAPGEDYWVEITETGGTIHLADGGTAGETLRIVLTTIVYGPFGSVSDLKLDGNRASLRASAGSIALATTYGSTAVPGDPKIICSGARLTIPSWWFLGHPDADEDMIKVSNGGTVLMGVGVSEYLGPDQSLASFQDAGSVLKIIGADFQRCTDQVRTRAFVRQSAVGGTLTAMGNSFEPIGTGSGDAFELLDNGLHIVTPNSPNGWNVAWPEVLTGAPRQGLYGPNAGPCHTRLEAVSPLPIRPDIDSYEIVEGETTIIGDLTLTHEGHRITLIAGTPVSFAEDSATVKLAYNQPYTPPLLGTIDLICQDGEWIERTRSHRASEWAVVTPTVTPTANTFGGGGVTASVTWRETVDGMFDANITVTVGEKGTATGPLLLTLPRAPFDSWGMAGLDTGLTGQAAGFAMSAASPVLAVTDHMNDTPGDGAVLRLLVSYRIA